MTSDVLLSYERSVTCKCPSAGFFAAADVGLYVTFIGGLVALVGVLLKNPISLKAGVDTRMAGTP